MTPKRILAGIGVGLAVLTFFVIQPGLLPVAVILIGIAVMI